MSKPTIINAQCPNCKNNIEVPYYEDINVVDHPEFKAAILAGSFFKYNCPHCHEDIPVAGPLLYHDPSIPSMIYYAPKGFDQSTEKLDEMMSMISSMEGDRASQYQARIVSSVDQLLEKIYIQDAKLDDRIVELVKLAYLKHYAKELESKGNIHATLFMPDNEKDKAQIVFILGDQNEMASIDFSKDYYAYFGTTFEEQLKKEDKPNQFIRVDAKWAAAFISNNRNI